MRVLVAGGGTGGHVVPALAVSAALKRAGAEVRFVGTTPADQKLVERAGFDFHAIPAGKLRRYFSLRTALEPFRTYAGYRASLRLLKEFKPDAVFAKGGYVALPVARAAKRLGIPTVLHESDLVPGLANRLAEKWAETVAVSFPPETMSWLPSGRVVHTGNPIRPELLRGNAAAARKRFGLAARVPTVLVLGGSQGSRAVNRLVREALPELLMEANVIHQTGERDTGKPSKLPKSVGRYHVAPYLGDELADCYAAADLVVSRAGAGGIAEIAAAGLPSVLIPLPSAAGDHQHANAKVFGNAKAALVLAESDLDGPLLGRAVKKLLHDPTRRSRMGRAARALAKPDAAGAVAKLVLEAGKRRG